MMAWHHYYSIVTERSYYAPYVLWDIVGMNYVLAPNTTAKFAFETKQAAIRYAEKLIEEEINSLLLRSER